MQFHYFKHCLSARWPFYLAATALQVSVMMWPAVGAAADGKTIVTNGVGSAPACAACHGENGEGQPDSGFPRLAGLDAAYITHQLQSFADDTRKNDVMKPVAEALSADDRKSVADYLSGLTPAKAAASDAPDPKAIAMGEDIAVNGLWPKGVPGCNQCHGPQGMGVGNSFPKLAGQSALYITSQIEAWNTGTRTNDPLSLMKSIAHKLSKEEVKAVADYYASLDPLGVVSTTDQSAKETAK